MTWRIEEGDCCEAMAAMDEASVDAVVTDPPYGLGFMGKQWDTFDPATMAKRVGTRNGNGPPSDMRDGRHKGRSAPAFANPGGEAGSYDFTPAGQRRFYDWTMEWAAEALRVLKPGGYLLAFGGSRTYHRLVCAVEDAGFEIRDTIMWLYGSGFPKSLDVSKAIDKAAGAEREVVGDKLDRPGYHLHGHDGGEAFGHGLSSSTPETRAAAAAVTAPSTPEAAEWSGWGTALKPAHEPIVVARKPLAGTVAGNVLEHGTGALNVDGCRIGSDGGVTRHTASEGEHRDRWEGNRATGEVTLNGGRWPANVVLDEEAGAMLDEQSGERGPGNHPARRNGRGDEKVYGSGWSSGTESERVPTEAGGASRFFYCAKADSAERNSAGRNSHPTVKPVALMRWLVRLVTPPDGLVLDPFAGSGTTGIAALREGFAFIGIEFEPAYCDLARNRIRDDAPLLNTASEDA